MRAKGDMPAQDHAPGRDLVQRMAVGDMVVLAALVKGLHSDRQGIRVAQVWAAAVELSDGQVLELRDDHRDGIVYRVPSLRVHSKWNSESMGLAWADRHRELLEGHVLVCRTLQQVTILGDQAPMVAVGVVRVLLGPDAQVPDQDWIGDCSRRRKGWM
jgi:hypothetical protein